jgi:hypothetical protein
MTLTFSAVSPVRGVLTAASVVAAARTVGTPVMITALQRAVGDPLIHCAIGKPLVIHHGAAAAMDPQVSLRVGRLEAEMFVTLTLLEARVTLRPGVTL